MINVGRSFGRRITRLEDLAPAFAVKASEKLQKQRSVCKGIQTHVFRQRATASAPGPLPLPSICEPVTLALSLALPSIVPLRCSRRGGGGEYSKGGICLLNLDQRDSVAQASLFDTYDENGSRISPLVSQVNAKFGQPRVPHKRTRP